MNEWIAKKITEDVNKIINNLSGFVVLDCVRL